MVGATAEAAVRELWTWAIALAILAPASLWSWHREPPESVRRGVKLTPDGTLKRLRWVTTTATVTLSREEEHWWFTQTRDGLPTRSFVGNARTSDWVDALVPFEAVRTLGPLDADTRSRLNLNRGCSRLELTLEAGEPRVFSACRSPADPKVPAARWYVQRLGEDPVHLVAAQRLRDLERPSRFRQRTLREGPLTDVAQVVLEQADLRIEAVRLAEGAPDAGWARSESPDTPAPAVSALVRALERTAVLEYPPSPEPGAPWLRVTWLDADGDRLGMAALADDAEGRVLARSEATHRWAVVPRPVAERLRERTNAAFGP